MTLQEISDQAEALADRFNPGNLAPFPYENVVAAQPDLDILFTELEDDAISGVTLFRDEGFIILVNSAKPETRQNFTLGHELGHYFLHKELLRAQKMISDGDAWLDGSNILYRRDGANGTEVETEANNFAASLIMPANLVRRAWKVTGSIEECASIFRVSAVAMSVRLTRLGLVR